MTSAGPAPPQPPARRPVAALRHLCAAALLLAGAAQAQSTQVLLVNAGQTDVAVQRPDQSIQVDIAPGARALARLYRIQWLLLGQQALRYDTTAIQRRAGAGRRLVIQVGGQGALYLLPRAAVGKSLRPPRQPRGFPVRPTRSVDLT